MAGKKKDGAKPKAKPAAPKKGAEKRVAQLRNKLTEAMQDPLMRDQIVRAIRAMMQEK
ncbi:MAG: hypothetical protein ACYCZX_02990 [Rhodospirillaceae bacterium]